MAALRASAACERQHLTVSAAYAHQLEDKQHRLLDCRRQLTPVDSVKERERAMKCKMMIRRRSSKRPGEKASGMKDFLRWRSRIGAQFIHAELIASDSSLVILQSTCATEPEGEFGHAATERMDALVPSGTTEANLRESVT